jgi:hypothetical protein
MHGLKCSRESNKGNRELFRQELKQVGIKECLAYVSVSYCCGLVPDTAHTVRLCQISIGSSLLSKVGCR